MIEADSPTPNARGRAARVVNLTAAAPRTRRIIMYSCYPTTLHEARTSTRRDIPTLIPTQRNTTIRRKLHAQSIGNHFAVNHIPIPVALQHYSSNTPRSAHNHYGTTHFAEHHQKHHHTTQTPSGSPTTTRATTPPAQTTCPPQPPQHESPAGNRRQSRARDPTTNHRNRAHTQRRPAPSDTQCRPPAAIRPEPVKQPSSRSNQ